MDYAPEDRVRTIRDILAAWTFAAAIVAIVALFGPSANVEIDTIAHVVPAITGFAL